MKASSRSKRPYVLKARGDQVAATRARIIDATVALHEEVGPRRTSIKAIAERAGVERLTVYRHFPDERAVLAACSACWAGRHPPPDPAGWQAETDPAARTQGALTALYRYFEDNRGMLAQVHRDLAELPALAEVTAPFLAYLAQVADDLAAAWNAPAPAAAPVSAVLRHLVRFETWALLHGAGWSNPQAVSLLLAWVEAVSSGRASRP
jgi:AcrR family transcriptional regulator